MDLRILGYFVCVIKEKSISNAAKTLHITQPTLSRQLQQLEDEFDTQLFIRGPKQIIPTDAGYLLYRKASELLEMADKIPEDIAKAEKDLEGSINIGTGETAAFRELTHMIIDFRKLHPKVKINVITGNADLIISRLNTGICDIGLLMEPCEITNLLFIKVKALSKWRVYMRADDRLVNKKAICPSDLTDAPILIPRRPAVGNMIENWFGDSYQDIDIAGTNDFFTNLMTMIACGFGRAIFVETSLKTPDNSTFVSKPLSPPLEVESVLAWKRDQSRNPAAKAFIDFVIEQYK